MNAMDTHRLVKRLEQVGFTEAQAETVTDAMRESWDTGLANLVTKSDLTAEIGALRGEMIREIGALRADNTAIKIEMAGLKALIAESRASTLQWVVGLLLAQTAMIAGLFKLIAGH